MLLHSVEMLAALTKQEQKKKGKRQMALGLGVVVLGLACVVRQWPDFDEIFRDWMLWAGIPVSVLLVLISGRKSKKVVDNG